MKTGVGLKDDLDPLRRQRSSKGFTLVELLVVIGIIAVLIAFLLPALTRARYQALLTTCMSHQRQFVAACLVYANEQRGFLPRVDFQSNAGGAGNCNDMPGMPLNARVDERTGIDTLLARYRVTKQMFFCPQYAVDEIDSLWNYRNRIEYFFGSNYAYWVQRSRPQGLIPPSLGFGSALGTSSPLQPVHAPPRVGIKRLERNPILSDAVQLMVAYGGPAPLGNVDISLIAPNRFIGGWSGHRLKGKLESINATFIDGHAERIRGKDIRARYSTSNAYNCR
jgi:prepilin-type N-terminal cleavage/methylation domain-containing protein